MLDQLAPVHAPASYLRQASRKLIMVSNRGPVEHYFDDAGRIRRREAAGGVATALGSVARQQPVTWIASAGTDADKAVGILDLRGHRAQMGEVRRVGVAESADAAVRTFELLMGSEVAPRREFIMSSSDRLSRESIDA